MTVSNKQLSLKALSRIAKNMYLAIAYNVHTDLSGWLTEDSKSDEETIEYVERIRTLLLKNHPPEQLNKSKVEEMLTLL